MKYRSKSRNGMMYGGKKKGMGMMKRRGPGGGKRFGPKIRAIGKAVQKTKRGTLGLAVGSTKMLGKQIKKRPIKAALAAAKIGGALA